MIYAISDLHGYPFDGFIELLQKSGFSDKDFLFILGDVIDRGNDGVKILRWAMSQPNVQLISGNHEGMMLSCRFLFDEITDKSLSEFSHKQMTCWSNWLANGAAPTVDSLKALSESERELIYEYVEDAPLYEMVDAGERTFLLTHSGLGSFEKDKKLNEYTTHDFHWNRPSLEDRYFDDVTVVFGHTPTANYGSEYEGKFITTDTWVNIDTGAGWGFKPAMLRLDDMKEIYLD